MRPTTNRFLTLLERATDTLDRMDRRLARAEGKPKPPEHPFDFKRHERKVAAALARLPSPRTRSRT